MTQLLKEFTKQAKTYASNTDISIFDYSINISLQYNYLYTETPKVACSTVKTILQKIELKNPNLYRQEFEDIHQRQFSPLLKPSQLGNLNDFINSDRLYKFCFSRNPYTRILSSYIDKIENNKPQKRKILKLLDLNENNLTTHISFVDFLTTIKSQKTIDLDPHWRCQFYQTFQDTIQYDFIGKIENFPDDLNKALKTITPDYKRYVSQERRHATNANLILDKYYTSETIKLVQNIYAHDFNHFNYSLDIHKAKP